MASSAAAVRRRRSANNARIAAKQRRQKILVVVLLAMLAALLAWEIPHLRARSSDNSASAAAPAPPTPIGQTGRKRVPGGGSGVNPFAVKSLRDGDAQAVTGGGPDPFKLASASGTGSVAALPGQIVIGQPGGHRVAERGWIVILASIPTGSGRGAAVRFARQARGTVGRLSVLNSSSRRPLRGGYWVVYSGPYSSIGAASRRAGDIHAAGYRSAYMRELITYQ